MFTRSAGVWSQQGAKLTGAGESGEGEFGEAVALSADGNTALVGGPEDDTAVGAAWVFTRSVAGVWSQQGSKLTGGEEGNSEFGVLRRALRRRQHGAGRRLEGQRHEGRGLGLHPHGLESGPSRARS